MKISKLIIVSMLLVSCGGGSGKDDRDPCRDFCIDLCNKAYVCGLSVECSDSKMDNCVNTVQRPWECSKDRVKVIGMSCNELRMVR